MKRGHLSHAVEPKSPTGCADIPNGVGAIRRFERGRFTTRERVTEFAPDRRLSYRLLSGLPLRDYEAHIDLEPGAPPPR